MNNEVYESGAIRSGDALGTDYWLITPIGIRRLKAVYEESYTPSTNADEFFDNIFEYLFGNRDQDYLALAARAICDLISNQSGPNYCGIPLIALRRLAETYNEGKNKYCAYNCELGFPIDSLINHAIKHVTDNMLNDSQEPSTDLPHALWNILMAMHSEECTPEATTQLRGANCTLTEAIREQITLTMEAKYGSRSETSIGSPASERQSPMRSPRRNDWTSLGLP